MPWVKGQSGNPTGRPRIVQGVRRQAQNMSEEALQVLVDVMRGGEKASERASAARTILQLAGAGFSEEGAAPEERAAVPTATMSEEALAEIATQGDA